MKTEKEILEWVKSHKCIDTRYDSDDQYCTKVFVEGDKLFCLHFCNGLPCGNDKKGYHEPVEVRRKTRTVEEVYYEDIYGFEMYM